MEFDVGRVGESIVTFAGGSLHETARVLACVRSGQKCLVIVDRTPFHPLSLRWPDQPGDHGQITLSDGQTIKVQDALTGIIDVVGGKLLTGEAALAVPRNQESCTSVVVHIVDYSEELVECVNTHVGLSVDPAIRRGLSLPHTAVHLAALALNAAGEQFWTKEHSDKDTLGRPNLDKAAVETSVIREGISTDSYRFGKSLRKKGFDRDKFLASLEEVGKQINATVSEWRKQESAVLVLPEIGSLDGLREWGCELDGRRAVIPCGGTHVRTLAEIEDIIVTLTRSDDGFTMVTVAS